MLYGQNSGLKQAVTIFYNGNPRYGRFFFWSTTAKQVNEGQVTVYPYEIVNENGEMEVARTHAQWFQLNPEDEDVTVWYCLSETEEAKSIETENEKVRDIYPARGTPITYEAMPNDTMNNYYIYSKNNIFYSGVGHSEVKGIQEARLLINVTISTYKAGSTAEPYVEITNAESTGNWEYEIKLPQTYSMDLLKDEAESVLAGNALYKPDETDVQEGGYSIQFKPTVPQREFECKIRYVYTSDESEVPLYYTLTQEDIMKLVKDEDGNLISAENCNFYSNEEEWWFKVDDQTYSLEYLYQYMLQAEDLNEKIGISSEDNKYLWIRKIEFYIRNKASNNWNVTTVDISVLPLFLLD